MREAKTYRDPYTDVARTPAFFGPYKRPLAERVADVLLAVVLGLAGAAVLFFGLSGGFRG
jgi:hypothetical protein